MLKKTTYTVAVMAAAVLLSGCNGQNPMFRPPSSTLSPVANAGAGAELTPTTGLAVEHQAPAAPYVLRAESAGPYINFSIYNLGDTDLVVEKQHLAVISQSDRKVFPYNKQTTVIDLPQPAIIPPNGTIEGRALFRDVNSPVGKRMVYKPDPVGTFADIISVSGLKPASPVPGQVAAQ